MAYQLFPVLPGMPVPGVGNNAQGLTPRVAQGAIVAVTSNFWGGGEMIWARASAAIRAQGLCQLSPVFDSALGGYRYDAAETPNTANTGRQQAVAMGAFASGEYGWFAISGAVPVNCTANLAANASIGVVAAGQAGAVSAGKQILSAHVAAASTTTVVRTGCTSIASSTLLRVPSADGWFVGAAVSGTGIPAATTITAIDPSERLVTISAATTAAVNGSVTCTYQTASIFYNVIYLNRAFLQGQIT